MSRRTVCRRCVLAVTLAVAVLGLACSKRGALTVTSVVRTDHVQYVGVGDQWTGDASQITLLLVKVEGMGRAEFDSLPSRDVYFASDTTRWPLKLIGGSLVVSSSGVTSGSSIELLSGVPRETLRFTLHLGQHPPLDVVVTDTTIRPTVRRPE